MRIYELEGKRTEDGKYHMQANQKEKKNCCTSQNRRSSITDTTLPINIVH